MPEQTFWTDVRYGKFDKSVHFCVALLLTLTLSTMMPSWTAALVVFILGLVKEFYDRLKLRSFDLFDVATNTLAIIAAVVLYHWIDLYVL